MVRNGHHRPRTVLIAAGLSPATVARLAKQAAYASWVVTGAGPAAAMAEPGRRGSDAPNAAANGVQPSA
ncbi:hypothetical protein ACFYUJ_32460 [Streptomyces sp. NPDC004520]|uniref:hypothetical protein n=1 Tax=Streptomyces sp. NPDC004520 TaxID=3364702 RepID=UPI00368C6504